MSSLSFSPSRYALRAPTLQEVGLAWGVSLVCFLAWSAGVVLPTYIKSSVTEYSSVKSLPFDGTVPPIAFVPDWTRPNITKFLAFSDVPLDAFVSLPMYEPTALLDTKNVFLRQTYLVPYMGSYRGNFLEYDGSHPGIDIRASKGTPVLSIANGVVTKSINTETANGKYVIVRYDNVPWNGEKRTFYASYLHLDEATAVAGTAVRKGDTIGVVGMTGIATTYHLHFQIDADTSPYHTYWPYTTQGAKDAGLDFFGAINAGLGKEDALRYTVNPMEFVAKFENANLADNTAVSGQTQAASVQVAATTPAENTTTLPEKTTTSISNTSTEAPPVTITTPSAQLPSFVLDGRSSAPISRSVALGAILTALGKMPATTTNDDGSLPIFEDVLPNDSIASVVQEAVRLGILSSSNPLFRPNDSVTRLEFITMLMRALELNTSVAPSSSLFADVTPTTPGANMVFAFTKALNIKTGTSSRFEPNQTIRVSEAATILQGMASKK